jgi:hypothetical protein
MISYYNILQKKLQVIIIKYSVGILSYFIEFITTLYYIIILETFMCVLAIARSVKNANK